MQICHDCCGNTYYNAQWLKGGGAKETKINKEPALHIVLYFRSCVLTIFKLQRIISNLIAKLAQCRLVVIDA